MDPYQEVDSYQDVYLSRISRKWAEVTVTATRANGMPADLAGMDFAVLPYNGTPNAGTAWVAADSFAPGEPLEDGTPTWLAQAFLAGPDATAPLVAPLGESDLWARVVDAQEVDVKMVARLH